jgi:predicted  nucleic acid-binding Zn-ribbon protein
LVPSEFARNLERELNAASERIEWLEQEFNKLGSDAAELLNSNGELEKRIKRQEDAGNEMAAWLSDPRNLGGGVFMASQWLKAKEAKP